MGYIIYGECHVTLPVGDITYAHATLTIAAGDAGGCALDAVTPGATHCGIVDRVVVGIVHGDGDSGNPCAAWISVRACPFQIADMHGGR